MSTPTETERLTGHSVEYWKKRRAEIDTEMQDRRSWVEYWAERCAEIDAEVEEEGAT